jgi:hypothetical protein
LRVHVFPTLGERPIAEITRRERRLWQEGLLAENLSAKTIQNIHGETVSPIFEAACLPGEDDEPLTDQDRTDTDTDTAAAVARDRRPRYRRATATSVRRCPAARSRTVGSGRERSTPVTRSPACQPAVTPADRTIRENHDRDHNPGSPTRRPVRPCRVWVAACAAVAILWGRLVAPAVASRIKAPQAAVRRVCSSCSVRVRDMTCAPRLEKR